MGAGDYEVQKIVKHRMNKSGTKGEFFVKWRGYDATCNSWTDEISVTEVQQHRGKTCTILKYNGPKMLVEFAGHGQVTDWCDAVPLRKLGRPQEIISLKPPYPPKQMFQVLYSSGISVWLKAEDVPQKLIEQAHLTPDHLSRMKVQARGGRCRTHPHPHTPSNKLRSQVYVHRCMYC